MSQFIDIRHDEERNFLRALRSYDEELVSAGRVFIETLHAAAELKDLGKCVTVFGSARFSDDHPSYVLAREMGRLLAIDGYTVVTGGGPGIMEAANRGAKDEGADQSVAISVYPGSKNQTPMWISLLNLNISLYAR